MSDGESAEQPIPKETITPASWTEIRNKYLNSSYSDTYEAAMEAFKHWEETPKAPGVDVDEWKRSIDAQITKARELPNMQRTGARTLNNEDTFDKISTIGNEIPPFGQGNTTRIYIGTDPREATDAYVALLDELEANGVLKDINASLNMEELKEGRVTGNMIIVYDPMSRSEVLDKILEAYRNARQKHPEPYALTPRQKATIMRENLRLFHATIDTNMSFVEQPATQANRSFDTNDAGRILAAFGLDESRRASLSDWEWLNHVKTRQNRIVYNTETQFRFDKQQIKPGDTLGFDRRLSAPAIIQKGTLIAPSGL